MKAFWLLLLPSLAAGTPSLAPRIPAVLDQPLPGDGLRTTIHRLSNGLTVYLSPNHEQPRVSAWIAVRAGSKNDPDESTGLAHYLEHMLFKGSASIGTLDYEKEKPHLDRILELYEKHYRTQDPKQREALYKEIDAENIAASAFEIPNELAKVYRQIGARGLNAFTSDEETVYVNDVPANRMEVWAMLESERFARPVFRLFQGELEAVYEEKNRSLDNPERLIDEALNRRLYKVHPYGQHTTLGTIEHLKNPSLARMYEFYRRYYVPNNMAIVLSGDFETKPMLALLERYFGAWTPKPLSKPSAWPLPKPRGEEKVSVEYEAEEKVVLAWPTVSRLHPDADALTVMDMLMDNASAGIINLTLNQAQKVKGAGSSLTLYNDAGDWALWALPKRGQTLEEAKDLLLGCVDKIRAGEFSDEDLRAVITNFEVGEKSRLESNEARAGYMADSFVHDEPWPVSAGRLERLRAVTKADVVRVASKYLGPDRVVAYRRQGRPALPSIAKPNFTRLQIEGRRQSEFARRALSLPHAPLEPRWLVEGRDYASTELPQGRLYSARNPFNDLFSLGFHFERGSRQERALCEALELWNLSGARELSAEEYRKRLFALGTSVSVSCGEQESAVSISGLNENLRPSLDLLLARFDAPNVATDTLSKMVDVAIGAHQDEKKDPNAVHGALGDYARRGKDSPVLAQLTDAELRSLKTDELRALIRRVFDFRHRVAYVGNRPVGELAKLLDRGRRYAAPPARRAVALARPERPRVLFTHRDMVQALVGVFAPDEPSDPRRYVDYSFLASYLGGGMSSLIFQEVREARSLAYSAWGGYRVATHKGDDDELYGELGCQADKTIDASTLLRGLLQSPPWSQPRFEETARAIEENYRTNPIPFRGVPSALMDWEDQGFSGDPRPERFARAGTYTLEDLKGFAARFKERPMTLYVLGSKDRVGLEDLKKLGSFEEKRLGDLFPY